MKLKKYKHIIFILVIIFINQISIAKETYSNKIDVFLLAPQSITSKQMFFLYENLDEFIGFGDKNHSIYRIGEKIYIKKYSSGNDIDISQCINSFLVSETAKIIKYNNIGDIKLYINNNGQINGVLEQTFGQPIYNIYLEYSDPDDQNKSIDLYELEHELNIFYASSLKKNYLVFPFVNKFFIQSDIFRLFTNYFDDSWSIEQLRYIKDTVSNEINIRWIDYGYGFKKSLRSNSYFLLLKYLKGHENIFLEHGMQLLKNISELTDNQILSIANNVFNNSYVSKHKGSKKIKKDFIIEITKRRDVFKIYFDYLLNRKLKSFERNILSCA